MVKLISSGSDFEKTFGYSRAVVDQDMVYVSGTTGYDYTTMTMPEDAGAQAANALETISKALKEAGSDIKDVVRVTYYLSDGEHEAKIVPAVGAVFKNIRPAATMVIAGLIRPEMKIEIEVTARIGAHAS